MEKGVSLVELIIALACSSVLLLALYQFHRVAANTHAQIRQEWYCMQSLRQACIRLNTDMSQCAFLLPQDLKVATEGGRLFIAGVPVTSENPGLRLSKTDPAPYYSLVNSSSSSDAVLDTIDIDNDGHADFWAGLGILTDCGPCLISHSYSRGFTRVPMTCWKFPPKGARAVPAVCYELKKDGLYRNNELLAEAVVYFNPRISGPDLSIDMRSSYHGTQKELSLSYHLQ